VRAFGIPAEPISLGFWFETRQEIPVAMVRVICESDLVNPRVNRDPANLILYGEANPVDTVGGFGRMIRAHRRARGGGGIGG
jgi:hypothetical protein